MKLEYCIGAPSLLFCVLFLVKRTRRRELGKLLSQLICARRAGGAEPVRSHKRTPDTRHQTPGTRHQAPGTRHQTPDTRHQTPDTRDGVLSVDWIQRMEGGYTEGTSGRQIMTNGGKGPTAPHRPRPRLVTVWRVHARQQAALEKQPGGLSLAKCCFWAVHGAAESPNPEASSTTGRS
jgi:hypothetical protein